jgi:GDP-mannose 6-dehydrogenase
MNISVFGLGYVGIVNVACFSKAGYKVWCTDVKPYKVELVKTGKSPIGEPEVDDLLQNGIKSGQIIPVSDAEIAVKNADILIVCVGTPSKPDGEVNLSYLHNVVKEMAGYLNPKDKKYLVFRSTVPPGTTETICNTYLSQFPGIIPVFYPEFLREGSAVFDFYNYGRLVLGHNTVNSVDALLEVLHVNPAQPTYITDLKTAEYSKYIDNGFHALKVAFANEIFGLANDLGVNVQMAHKIFTADTRLNISPYYTRPGMPFGGSCLPKDLRELQYLMKKGSRDLAIMSQVTKSNDAFIADLYNKIKNQRARKIFFAGITFKNHSDDLRESPILRIINDLEIDKSFQLSIADDDLNLDALKMDYPQLFEKLTDWNEGMFNADLIVVSKRYLQKVLETRKANQPILNFSDQQGILEENLINLYN